MQDFGRGPVTMAIRIIRPGLLTTIQDLGRTGFQKFGVSPSGAMDRRALSVANLLVGNAAGEAGLEMTLTGAEMEFTVPNVVAVTGGNFAPVLNGASVPLCAAFPVKAGDTLSFGAAQSGCRCYAAFAGGLNVPVVMGSKSTNLKCGIGGFEGRKLKAGDEIGFSAPAAYLPDLGRRFLDYREPKEKEATLRVVLGPQDDCFTEAGLRTFLESTYTVTNRSDRMGCALDGPKVEYRTKADIISDGIPFGAVQIPSGGKPILMLSDRQTTGGYAKIATVLSTDLPLFVQRKAGDKIHFEKISMRKAQAARRREFREMLKLQDKFL